jgi:hypothetical protein
MESVIVPAATVIGVIYAAALATAVLRAFRRGARRGLLLQTRAAEVALVLMLAGGLLLFLSDWTYRYADCTQGLKDVATCANLPGLLVTFTNWAAMAVFVTLSFGGIFVVVLVAIAEIIQLRRR